MCPILLNPTRETQARSRRGSCTRRRAGSGGGLLSKRRESEPVAATESYFSRLVSDALSIFSQLVLNRSLRSDRPGARESQADRRGPGAPHAGLDLDQGILSRGGYRGALCPGLVSEGHDVCCENAVLCLLRLTGERIFSHSNGLSLRRCPSCLVDEVVLSPVSALRSLPCRGVCGALLDKHDTTLRPHLTGRGGAPGDTG